MNEIQIHNPQTISVYARQFASSGLFQDARQEAQAFVKIAAGVELGFGPFQSLTGIHIVQGKPTISAGLMASAVKASGKYDYRVTKHTDTECVLEFREGKEVLGESNYTTKMANDAGLMKNPVWKNHPKNMLFARAMSNGVKWYCPDVLGSPFYTPEEMGAEVDENGDIIDTTAVVNQKPKALPETSPADEAWADPDHYKRSLMAKVGDKGKGWSKEEWIKFFDEAVQVFDRGKYTSFMSVPADRREAFVGSINVTVEASNGDEVV